MQINYISKFSIGQFALNKNANIAFEKDSEINELCAPPLTARPELLNHYSNWTFNHMKLINHLVSKLRFQLAQSAADFQYN